MMKKILLATMLMLSCTLSAEPVQTTRPDPELPIISYGNGVFYMYDTFAKDFGARLSQFKKIHPDCFVSAIAPVGGQFGPDNWFINCQVQHVYK